MVPLLLAEAKSRIKTKITLLAIQIGIAVLAIILKALAFTKLDPNSELASKKDLAEFLGIYLNSASATFVSDPL